MSLDIAVFVAFVLWVMRIGTIETLGTPFPFTQCAYGLYASCIFPLRRGRRLWARFCYDDASATRFVGGGGTLSVEAEEERSVLRFLRFLLVLLDLFSAVLFFYLLLS